MDQLPHAPVCIAISVSGVVLWQALDEDGAQRLVLTVVNCGISIEEELPAMEIIPGCALKCEVVFRGVLSLTVVPNWEPRAKPDGTRGFGTRRNRGRRTVARQNSRARAAENRITSAWAGQQEYG